ncbi:hypothetical protein J4Q44_G00279450 [Coregonus suidteri]|uniref:Cadherin domain-containing protein n=1 Tax=Coregonus suidteri TaxID=861788 RepID=A0AAN8KZK7_9TELE
MGAIYREILANNLLPSVRALKMGRGWGFSMTTTRNTQPGQPRSGSVRGISRVNSNATISTAVPLDREVRGQYDLIVEAEDGAVEDPRRTTLTLSVTVLDVDDNSPVFSQLSYTVNLPENSPKKTVILQLTAKDADLDSNITFRIRTPEAKQLFDVNPVTGELSVLQTLDFETLAASDHTYTFMVEAHSGGSMPQAWPLSL